LLTIFRPPARWAYAPEGRKWSNLIAFGEVVSTWIPMGDRKNWVSISSLLRYFFRRRRMELFWFLPETKIKYYPKNPVNPV
jgi:hypothetical protein